jgi:uncharacterized protein YndB with AHSA1/START domain
MTQASAAKPAPTGELTIVRVFDAPRALVFAMWTEPRHLAQWWGPKDFTNPVCEVDLRVGGMLRIVMRSPEGNRHPVKGIFREIVAPEKLVFTNDAIDEEGHLLLEGLTTVTFAEKNGKTEMTLHTRVVGVAEIAAQMIGGMNEGWTQSIDRLEMLVAITNGNAK